MRRLWSTLPIAVILAACGDDATTGPADTTQDTVFNPDGSDTSTPDTTPADTGSEVETSTPDTTPADTEPADTEPADTTPADTTPGDTGPTEVEIVQPEGTSAQIQALIDLAAGSSEPIAVSILVEDATVTATRPEIGNDAPGFFIQDEASGPAIFVVHRGAAPIVRNDIVTLRTTEIAVVSGVVMIAGFTDLEVQAGGGDADLLVQDVTGVDLVGGYDALQSEHIELEAEIVSDFGGAGQGYVSAQIVTDGVTSASDGLRVRLPATVVQSLALSRGCLIALYRGVIWRFRSSDGTFSQTQPSVYDELDILAVCNGPELLTAAAASPTSVVLSFDKPVDPASITDAASQFTIDNGLTVSAAVASGNTVTLTTSAQTPGVSYTVTIAESVTDVADRPVIAQGTARTFEGFAGLASLVINELDYDQPGNDTLEFVELYNPGASAVDLAGYQLELINGGAATPTTYTTLVLSGTIAAGGYAVIAAGAVTVGGGATVVPFAKEVDNIQNGGTDGVRLTTVGGGLVIDALLYEVPAETSGAILAYAEGTGLAAGEDNLEPNKATARCPNGSDTNDNNVDFKIVEVPTPGAANACP